MPTAGATLRPVKGGDNMTTPLEEILKTYDTARHYNSELTPDNFASLYRLHEAGTLNIDDIIQGDKTAALIGTKQESAARAGLNKLINRIHSPNNYSCAPSGYKAVDRLLDGGFYAGLYVIGAISGLGKTTFINNVADNMAKAGRKVIYISLEMATEEIIAKSISRLTYEQAQWIEQLFYSHDVRMGTRYGQEPGEVVPQLLPKILITDFTCEIDDADGELNTVKFTYQFADRRTWLQTDYLTVDHDRIFTEQYDPTFS